ncbi:MFS general substrate transporter [Aspergillus sclerotioniger CBS 115572]|uniref:MFS general substrate transporter n=1 Tax=Aspergillus sclerotioniger CBS 115572 TaxID=1450535 RepID=A0A317VS03_9EURO|nr:MFS general substrate transporter [Aspergillus sclerotioniger CBS 115572]PWY76081.1 MFS general substrate transporter [Aspergillus sclerotioniger CBS 115572]
MSVDPVEKGVAISEAAMKRDESSIYIDHDAERSYVRKVDFCVLPLLCLSNLANAKTDGLDEDIHLKGNDYSLMVLLFYIPFGLCDLPWNLLLKRYGGRLTLSFMTVVWGILALCQCAVKDFGGMIAVRMILGVFEAGFFAGATFYMTLFYTRGEMGFRLAIMQSFAVLASAFSGLISFGVFQIHDPAVEGWQWLFIIEGSMTFLMGIASLFWLPGNPRTAWFLNERERAAATARQLRDTSSEVDTGLDLKAAFETWKDWKFPIWCIITFTYPVAYATAMNFFPLIVERLGYSTVKTNLWTVAPNLVGAVVLLCVAKSSDYFRERTRSYIPSCLVHAWHNNNNMHENSRAANTGFFVGLGNLAGILSAATFRTEYAPKYIPTLVATCCCNGVCIVVVTGLGWWMRRENGRRDRIQGRHLRPHESHVCHWPNCGKTFTRAEHLRRHALNHESARDGYTCRHLMRHAKRDEEAGGPGLGVLETRKRTRRAGDGSIITRPPKRQSRASAGPSLPSSSCASSSSISVTSAQDYAPVSPPTSASDPSCLSLDEPDPLLAPMMPSGPFEPYVEPIPGQFDAADGSWSLGLDGMGDFFSLDTATDFNMPFAATHNYNWLFDVASLDDAFQPFELPLGPDMMTFADALPIDDPKPVFDRDGSSVLLEAASFVERGDFAPLLSAPLPEPPDSINLDWMDGSSLLQINPQPHLPILTDNSRRGILALVAQAPPLGIDGQPTPLDSPLLSLSSLQSYSDLFFTRFNTTYPLIHQPTFDPSTTTPVLLAAILSMGATYSSREAHQLAVGIHDSLRNQLFLHPDFSPQPDLWVLQAMLLIDCFGKMRAGPKQRERAQLFHCVLIKLIRRSDCCAIRTTPSPPNTPSPTLTETWHSAMHAEQKKRLALHCFMWDTQHAVLFSQSLCMSAFEIRSSLPCSPSAWEASTAEEWARHTPSSSNNPLFLTVLKGYITPATTPRPRDLNVLARSVILHGLMSVSADLKRRDQTTLRSHPEKVGAWTHRMARSYDLWKVDFDADCLAMKLGQTAESTRRKGFTGLKMAAGTLYRAAHVALRVEILDLQIAAGAGWIMGREVTGEDRERSVAAVRRGQGQGGGMLVAARHAAMLLQDAVLSLHDWEQTDAFHFPWCLYLGTLMCWAFHGGVGWDDGGDVDSSRVKTDLASLIVAMTTCGSLDELAAIEGKTMAQQLATVRWAVVHDAMKVLVNLAG